MEISTTTAVSHVSQRHSMEEREAALVRICDSGFHCLDFNLPHDFVPEAWSEPEWHFCGDNWRQQAERMRKLAENHGARFTQTHGLVHNYFAQRIDTEANNLLIDRALEITALLGADVTVFHPVAPPGAEYDRKACLAANRDFIRRKAETAAKLGVRIAVENMLSNRLFDGGIFKRACTNSEELLELVEAIDMENVGACVDVGHMHYMGEDIYSGIMRMSPKLIALHIHDNDGFNDGHIIPMSGNLPFQQVYRALQDGGYTGKFTLEVLHYCENLPDELQLNALTHLRRRTEWMAHQCESRNNIN